MTIEIVGEFEEAVSAWKLWKSERPELVKAGQMARKRDAVLVAISTSRFVRNKRHQRGVSPTEEDFEQLIGLVGKARLATLLLPERQDERGSDTKRGHRARGACPGRPPKKNPGYKKRRRMQFKLPVIRLCKQRFNNYEIARQLELPEKTVRDWRKRYRKYLDASFLRK